MIAPLSLRTPSLNAHKKILNKTKRTFVPNQPRLGITRVTEMKKMYKGHDSGHGARSCMSPPPLLDDDDDDDCFFGRLFLPGLDTGE
jgi:hypothetical protein